MKAFGLFIKKLISYIFIFLFFQSSLWGYLPNDMSSFESNVVLAKWENGKIRPWIKTRSRKKLKAVSKNLLEDNIIWVDAEVASWTIVGEKSGDLQAIENFVSNPSTIVSLKDEVFRLWYTDKYLTFSKPVKLTFTTQYKKWTHVRPLVQHYWDDKYNTLWLTTSPDATCNDWVAVNEKFDTVTVGKKWVVEFYTCWASTFTMNPAGGTSISNDIKLLIWDCWQVQVYYKGYQNIYLNNPPTTWCNWSPSAWLRLRVWNRDIWNGGSTSWSTYSTVGSTNGNTYTATSSMTRTISGRTYALNVYRTYTAPNTFFTWTYDLTIPSGNTQSVRLYYWMDSYVAWWDANDVGYLATEPSLTAWVYDNVAQVLSAMRYLTWQTWAWYEAAWYSTISSRITSWADFNNTIQSTPWDLWYGINWSFWSTPWTYTSTTEWRMAPYVANTVPDLIASVWQPEPNMQVNVISQLPVVVSNVWNADSTGTHSIQLTLPSQITWPAVPFTSNGWDCSWVNSQVVTCTNVGINIPALWTDSVYIPVIPQASASWLTLPFTWSVINASDSNTTNNTWVTNLYIAVAPAPADNTPPNISFLTLLSWSIRPIWTLSINVGYFDTWTAMNLASDQVILQKWSGSTRWGDIATWIVDFSNKVLTDTWWTYPLLWLSYWKYQVTYSIRDMAWNTGTWMSTFYIDEPEINISTGNLNVWVIPYNTTVTSLWDITVTIKTVWAWINLTLNQNTELSEISWQSFPRWDWTQGFWYQVSPYTGDVIGIWSWWNLVLTQTQSINTDGLKNTYTFTLKPSMKFIEQWLQVAGDYSAQMGFITEFNY